MENNIGVNEYQVPWDGPAKGWQCPCCGRVYSPTTPMCWYCGGSDKKTNIIGTGTDISPFIDWCKNISSTLSDIPNIPKVTLRGFVG